MDAVRNTLRSLALVVFLAAALPAGAATERPFDPEAFAAAQDAGKPILVEIHAGWCPTCRAQQPILDKLSELPKYSGIERFRVDFDAQKDVVRQFKAKVQSTLVVYKGRNEMARSVGDTDQAKIRALLDKAL